MTETATYTVATVQHTCWDSPGWNGAIQPATCDGCAAAEKHPCDFCGFGVSFGTHNPDAHAENGDPQVPQDNWPEDDVTEWLNGPHIQVTA